MTLWKFIGHSVAGVSHERHDIACQDAAIMRSRTLPTGERYLLLACADGMGSARMAAHGSKIACSALVEVVERSTARCSSCDELMTETYARTWFDEVHRALEDEAELLGCPIRDLACTLLFALCGPKGSVFGQLGDGVIVARANDGIRQVFWPMQGEFANVTYTMTNREQIESACICSLENVDGVILSTDGMQYFLLDYPKESVDAAFASGLFRWLRETECPEQRKTEIDAFLRSARVTQRTDDDTTLVIAVRASDAA
ncbi:MAG: protein phosphatase 2C domain-containing protein [Phycisphaerae bacterium]|nr:protein phosphatase 2C domain-containing protein [Phycisphaerae bacterium]